MNDGQGSMQSLRTGEAGLAEKIQTEDPSGSLWEIQTVGLDCKRQM